jgi:hypothetical protein
MIYTVRINGYAVKQFENMLHAKRFMIDIQIGQQEKLKALSYIDEAVMKSDLKEANEVLSYIMEK